MPAREPRPGESALRRFRAIEHRDVADDLNERALRGRRYFFGQFLTLILELDKLDLDEAMAPKFLIGTGEKSVGKAVATNFEHGLKKLRFAPKASSISRCQKRFQAG